MKLNIKKHRETDKNYDKLKRRKKKIIAISLSIIILFCIVYKYMNTYVGIEYKDIDGGIKVVNTDDEIRFEVDNYPTVKNVGYVERISVDLDNKIVYTRIYLYIQVRRWHIFVGEPQTISLLNLTKDGKRTTSNGIKMAQDKKGNSIKCKECISEVYYQHCYSAPKTLETIKEGEPVLIWKRDN